MFYEAYKGTINIWGVATISQDWPLINLLRISWLPQDVDKEEWVKQLGAMY